MQSYNFMLVCKNSQKILEKQLTHTQVHAASDMCILQTIQSYKDPPNDQNNQLSHSEHSKCNLSEEEQLLNDEDNNSRLSTHESYK